MVFSPLMDWVVGKAAFGDKNAQEDKKRTQKINWRWDFAQKRNGDDNGHNRIKIGKNTHFLGKKIFNGKVVAKVGNNRTKGYAKDNTSDDRSRHIGQTEFIDFKQKQRRESDSANKKRPKSNRDRGIKGGNFFSKNGMKNAA